MMRTPSMCSSCRRNNAISALLLVVSIGCQEEQLAELSPEVSICPIENAPQDQCDRDVDLGEIPVTVPAELTLFIRDVGGARLEITEVTSSDPSITVVSFPDEIFAGQEAAVPLTIELDANQLGPITSTFTVVSNAKEKPQHSVDVILVGVPKPAPQIEVCIAGEDRCGTDLDFDFGSVRHTQQEGLELVVKNVGTAPLEIQEVRLDGATSVAGEIVIATSTRPAELDVDDSAPMVIIYRPEDAGLDQVTLVILSSDEDDPEAVVRLRGSADENLPPTSLALETLTRQTQVEVIVGDVVQADGSGSSDPEDDPLVFSWTLAPPAFSVAALDDPTAVRAAFVPDVAGEYLVSLVVRDSLGQESNASDVIVTARPRFGFRAELEWADGGDVDLHIVEQGAGLFSDRDCSFANRSVDFGVAGVTDDDCTLIEDALGAPGREQAVIIAPSTGTYEIWVHLFDDNDLGPVEVTARIIIDDAASPAMLQTRQLPGDCATWHVANMELPSGTITVIDGAIGSQCL